tara:strand:+ start:620 stop:937 length:318 start_codon:yes stop_codon:yes gene_type:complete
MRERWLNYTNSTEFKDRFKNYVGFDVHDITLRGWSREDMITKLAREYAFWTIETEKWKSKKAVEEKEMAIIPAQVKVAIFNKIDSHPEIKSEIIELYKNLISEYE